ncbi:energy transducer TonB [Halopseudomonas salina]|uniref:Protein TonB n=1 Tax=Halopseudomonas salina TaxID=1323744 RepID=A0ABQ1PTN7_9GAMM|nr:energy transducer TonB [Halopseudomonas salina]GGD03226.1 protein TonB [Halopseudomonas salina]
MTAMLPPTTQSPSHPSPPSRLGHFAWPAVATMALHGSVFALLLGNWSPEAPAVATERVLRTQLVTINTAPAPEPPPITLPEPPAPEPPPPPPSPPAEVKVPDPVKPQIDHAAIARKRVEEEKRREEAKLAEQQRREQARIAERQRLKEEQRREQQRLEQLAAEQAHHEALDRAEQQRLAAAKSKAAADTLSQYQPISKKPPAYPKRALDRHKEGDCTVEYTVTAQGKVKDPVVVEGGCDDMVFARPSLTSAKSFRYQPRVVNGVAVAVPGVRNTFRFRLEQ